MSLSQTEFVCQNEILQPLFFLIKNKASFTTKNFSQFQASSLRVLFICKGGLWSASVYGKLNLATFARFFNP